MGRSWVSLGAAAMSLVLAACGGGGGAQTPESGAPTPLVIANTSVAPGGEIHPDAAVTLYFGRAVDAQTLGSDGIRLFDGSASVPVRVAVDGTTVTVTPLSALRLRRQYELVVKAGLRSTAGGTLATDYRLGFSTLRIAFDVRTLVGSQDFAGGGLRPMIAVADLDGDGRQDVATLSRLQTDVPDDGYTLQLYRQEASGSLTLMQRYHHSLGQQLFSINYTAFIAIDTDHDGVPELAVAEYQPQPNAAAVDSWPLTGIRIFARGGDGRFAIRQYLRTAYVKTLQAGDLDGDGRADLVGSHSYDSSGGTFGFQDSGYQAFLSRPGGLQALPRVAGLPDIVDAVVLADLNRDGRLDLMFSQRPGVLAFSGDGAGGFVADAGLTRALEPFCADWCPQPFLIDLNDDGLPDFTWSDLLRPGLISRPDGSFQVAPKQLLPTTSGLMSPRAGDLDGDGREDLLFLWSCELCPVYVTTLFGNGTPLLDVTAADPYVGLVSTGAAVRAGTALVDLDGDGRLEMLLSTTNTGLVLLKPRSY